MTGISAKASTTPKRKLGKYGEDLASQYLKQRGYKIIARNWRCRHGELDIIACDPVSETIIFCEVKCRSGVGYGYPLAAITASKQEKIRSLAQLWLSQNQQYYARIRIDAIGILISGPKKEIKISHIAGVQL